MGDYGKPGYLNLNSLNQWPGFKTRGLELGSDGTLRLFRVPRLTAVLPAALEQAQPPATPPGLAVTPDGGIFYTDGVTLHCVNGCADQTVVSCAGSMLAPVDRLIAIADAVGQRVLLFDPPRASVTEIWHGIAAGATAGDGAGNIYIADTTGNRIRRFDRFGISRWESAAPLIDHPVAIAAAAGKLFALGRNSDGQWQIVSWDPAQPGAAHVHAAGMLQQPMGLAASADAIYVGDNSLRRILKISVDSDSLAGIAAGYRGPVGALALDGAGNLYVYAAAGTPPLQLSIDAGS